MIVRNTSTEQKTIQIVTADGKQDTITLMPRGGNAVTLPQGSRLDPNKIAEYKVFLRTNPPLEAKTAPAKGAGE